MVRKTLPQFVFFTALIAVTTISQAQTHRKVTLEAAVPFEFEIGNRAFPAGTYVFEMATGSPQLTDHAGVLVVRNHQRKLYAAVAADVAADAAPHTTPKLVFQRNGERVFLAKVWRQGNVVGLSVHRAPASIEEEWQESQVLMLDATPVSGAI